MNEWYSRIQQSKRCAPNSLFSLSTLDSPLDITVLLPFWVRLLLCRETKYQAHMVQLRNQSRKRTFLSQLLSLVKSSTTTVAGGCRPPRLQSESWPQQDTRAAAPGEPVPSQPQHHPLTPTHCLREAPDQGHQRPQLFQIQWSIYLHYLCYPNWLST